MIPRPGMRYVRPDGSGARVVRLPGGELRAIEESTGRAVYVEHLTGYAPDWSDGATLGAVEHDVLGPARWVVDRRDEQWRVWHPSLWEPKPWRASLAEALRDALEVIDG